MAITAVKYPYEFLARWDKNGVLQGAHVGWRYIVTDGDSITETLTPVEAVDVAGNTGFPLSDILSQLQIDAIAATNQAVASKELADAARLSAVAAMNDAIAAKELADAALAEAQDA